MTDLLSSAARALRDTTESDDASARFTRARIMASVHQGRVRRRTRLAFVLPLAASFVAASAWGAASGKASAAFAALTHALGLSAAPPAASSATRHAPRASRLPRAPATPASPAPLPATPPEPSSNPISPLTPPPPANLAPPAVPEPASPSPTAPASPSPAAPASPLAPRIRSTATAPVRAASPAPSLSPADPTLGLYRVAHRAHFVDRDPAAALTAWDAYLRAAPSGPFALEARYNRALDLIRLGRTAEARAALAPFARGAFGTYRKREASALLSALPE